MRGGDFERARRQLVEGQRLVSNNSPDTECDRIAGLNTCADELRYLNAEVLNQSGRLDDAVTAYRALDRRSATSAMRQNALYAAAQIERRQGHPKAAASDFERASAVAPRGALHEDALAGAMQSASDAGDKTRARELAARYLREYPRGLTAPAARKLAGDGAP
jgi:outer membrane protein assembly factor BamD (BamD/ComL family)